jgi:PKD repeat protein
MQAAHVYLVPGTYRITLTVRDAIGNVSVDAAPIAVSPLIGPVPMPN